MDWFLYDNDLRHERVKTCYEGIKTYVTLFEALQHCDNNLLLLFKPFLANFSILYPLKTRFGFSGVFMRYENKKARTRLMTFRPTMFRLLLFFSFLRIMLKNINF